MRRNAVRAVTLTASNTSMLDPIENGCGTYAQAYPSEGEARVCVPTDPWYALPDNISVQYQQSLPNASSSSGSLHATAEGLTVAGDELVLKAPAGLDLCGSGVLDQDLVAVSTPADQPRSQSDPCASAGGEEADALLKVTRAYPDKLVLQAGSAAEATFLVNCFKDGFVRFDVRASGYLAIGSTYLHNVIVAPDGRCIPNTERPTMTLPL